MAKILEPFDTINGKLGIAYAKIDGNNEEMFYAKDIKATVDKTKADVSVLGDVWTGSKTMGLKGTGTMTIYYVTSKFAELIKRYSDSAVDTYFEMVITNNDPSSAAGMQEVVIHNVNLNSAVIAQLDAAANDPLDESIDFTFTGFDILTPFKEL